MLIICSECGKEYSDQAKSCPHCGAKTSQNRYLSNNMRGNYKSNSNSFGQGNNSNIIAFIIGIILLIAAVYFISNSFKDFSSFFNGSNSNSNTNNNSSFSDNNVYSIGNKIVTNKYEITVTNVEQRNIVGTKYLNDTAGEGNTYVCVTVKIKNITNEPINTFLQPSFYLEDSQNITYKKDVGASALYGTEVDDTSKTLSDLNPGVTVYDTGVFQLGKEKYNRDSFKLKIEADKTIIVKIK